MCFLAVHKTHVYTVTFMHVWNYDKTHGLCTTSGFCEKLVGFTSYHQKKCQKKIPKNLNFRLFWSEGLPISYHQNQKKQKVKGSSLVTIFFFWAVFYSNL